MQSIQAILDALGDPSEFPRAALVQARAQWPALLPYIDKLLASFNAGQQLSAEESKCLYYGVLLLADRAETSRLDAVIELCDREDGFGSALDCLLGDTLTEKLSTILYILADGRHQPLLRLLSSSDAGEYVKESSLEVLFAQLEKQRLDRDTLSREIPAIFNALSEEPFLLSRLGGLLIYHRFDDYRTQLLELQIAGSLDTRELLPTEISQWQLEEPIQLYEFDASQPVQLDVLMAEDWIGMEQEMAEIDELRALIELYQQEGKQVH